MGIIKDLSGCLVKPGRRLDPLFCPFGRVDANKGSFRPGPLVEPGCHVEDKGRVFIYERQIPPRAVLRREFANRMEEMFSELQRPAQPESQDREDSPRGQNGLFGVAQPLRLRAAAVDRPGAPAASELIKPSVPGRGGAPRHRHRSSDQERPNGLQQGRLLPHQLGHVVYVADPGPPAKTGFPIVVL